MSHRLIGYFVAVMVALAASALPLLSPRYLSLADAAMLYLLCVVLVATRFGAGPAIASALIGVAGFDWILPPTFRFSVADMGHVVTLGVMIFVSVLVSGLTERLRRAQRRAQDGERRSAALYQLERSLSEVQDVNEATARVVQKLDEIFGITAQVSHAAGSGQDELSHDVPGGAPLSLRTSRRLDEPERELALAMLQRLASAQVRLRLANDAEAARLEAQLERVRAALLSSVSHDLRTPLASISASAQMLLRENAKLDADARGQLLGGIAQEADRLDQLLKNLLAMTRVEAGKLEPRLLPTSVEELLSAAVRALEPRLESRRLTYAFAPALPLVDVDAPLITQVVVNLLENAMRYSSAGSTISVGAVAVENDVELTIDDEGIGIPDAERRAVFEKFRRASNAPHDDGGVGLGLTIAKAVVEAHGGRIEIGARAGVGTRVSLRLRATRLAPNELERHLPSEA